MKLGRNYLKNFLRLLWVLVILWYELVVFHRASGACSWPDSGFPEKSRPTHVLLVADPQIIDQRSYPDRNFIVNWLTRFIVDLNLRKNWRAALRSQPDAVFFLGDMMDGGRVDMSDSEYEALYGRFLGIFKLDKKIPRYCIPGNHDTGLGVQHWFSPDARGRYRKHFGPLNREVAFGNHTFVLLDAPGLVEEDYRRHGSGKPYSEWVPARGGSIEFVKSFAKEEHEQPVILLSHIPLSRPEGSNCGPLRERGTIRRGVGVGYQNTLGKDSSRFLLSSLSPILVFSGDDHDYCDYTHAYSEPGSLLHIREVTVKSLSMAMGIRYPGYHLLSLIPSTESARSYNDALCLMPDQIGIYLSTYLPLIALSLLVLLISCFLRTQNLPRQSHSKNRSIDSSHHRFKPTESDSIYSLDEEGGYQMSPLTQTARYSTHPQGHRERGMSIHRRLRSFLRRGTFLGEYLRDIRDVAVFPLALFVIISMWIMTD